MPNRLVSRANQESLFPEEAPDAVTGRRTIRSDPALYYQARRGSWLRRRYGMTEEDFDKLLIRQSGRCYVCCGAPGPDETLYVDHNHGTGAVRALLCDWCNRGLGLFQEDPEKLRAAVRYLELFQRMDSLLGTRTKRELPKRVAGGWDTSPEGVAKRFWAKVLKGPQHWLWDGTVDKQGKPRYESAGKSERCYTLAWRLSGRELPEGSTVRPCLAEPLCVNPACGELTRKKRSAKEVLTPEQEEQIRKEVAQGTPQRRLAERFGVHHTTICRVILPRRRTTA